MFASCTRLLRLPHWPRLPRRAWYPGTRAQARRRLRLLVGASFVCLALPVALLLGRVYAHMQREVFYQYRASAEEVVARMNQRLVELLYAEENRAFDEYSFFTVTTNPLLQGTAVTTSPLSTLPPSSAIPGLLGYFQINPDGGLQSPVLPELSEAELSANSARFGFGAAELDRRLALRRQLTEWLLAGASAVRAGSRWSKPEPAPPGAALQGASKDAATPSMAPLGAAAGSETAAAQALRDATSPSPTPASPREAEQQESRVPKLSAGKSSPYRERRKEQVTLPEQSTASQVQGALERLNTLPRQDGSLPVSRGAGAPPAAPADSPVVKRQDPVKILTFEGEVDPLHCAVLRSGPLVFYRKAWRNNVRYVQGFVVEAGPLFEQLIATTFHGMLIGQRGTLTVQYQDTPLLVVRSTPAASRGAAAAALPTETGAPLYRAALDAPLDGMELRFHVVPMPRGAGASVVDGLVLVLGLVLIVGHYGIYRVGMQHIELAVQRSDFVSAVSHELKTPLTSIRMYGEMLREGWITDEARRQAYYDFIFFESERLSRLISNVLQLARLGNHTTPLVLQEYTPFQLLDVIRSKVATQAEAAGFTMAFVEPSPTVERDHYTVRAEADALAQICINLVDNAIKFSAQAEPKHIEVGLRLPGNHPVQAVFFVRDFGPGVPPDQMTRIFQPFYRGADALARQTQGTGIGLALVHELATQMQGRVELENQYPGVEFRVLLTLTPTGAAPG